MFSGIVAIGKNNEIGKNNQLLWHLPEDLKNFKSITTGKTIIMGRKTFESIGKVLPNRRNIILSRQVGKKIQDAEVFHSLEEVINLFENSSEEVFIIGGADLYKEMMSKFDKLYISFIKKEDKDADAFFPKINFSDWEIVEGKDHEEWDFRVLKRVK